MHEGHTLRIAACEVLAVARIGEGVEHRDMSIGWLSSTQCTKLEPMNPAPPVTTMWLNGLAMIGLLLRAAVILSYSVKDILALR